MQRLLHHPVFPAFFAIVGTVLTQLGYGSMRRGFVEFIPEQGPKQIFSPASSPSIYWLLSSGTFIAGILCLLLSAYSTLSLIRAYRAGKALSVVRASPFGLVMLGLGFVVMAFAIFAGTCTRR